jgi:hypothetical protein
MNDSEHEISRDAELARLFERIEDGLTDADFVERMTHRLRTRQRRRMVLCAAVAACCVVAIALSAPLRRIGDSMMAASDLMMAIDDIHQFEPTAIALALLSLAIACVISTVRLKH